MLSDEIRKLPTVRAAHKLLGLDILSEKAGSLRIVTLYADNSLTVHGSSLDAKEDKNQMNDQKKENLKAVRCILFLYDLLLIL